ncbi:hypothetical protein [Nocardia sp. NPDC050175]|uniref:WXG100-like domain-containing protein n=1 Tax=Nocardia sp. NPDC050175 TaxID=3364317 RepID=UPI0037BE1340
MSIEMPEGLQWLSYLAGASWPKGDEDALFALGDDWKSASKDLHDLIEALHVACNTAQVSYSGDGADKMKKQFDQFFAGDQSVEKLAEQLEQLGESVRQCGTQTEYAKLQIIITLAILAAEIAYALATLWGAWAVPAMEAEAAGVCQLIGQRLITFLANRATRLAQMPMWKLAAITGVEQAAIGLGADALAQGIQLGKGHRDSFDVKQMVISGAVGGISGAVAAPVGSMIGKRLGNWVGHDSMTWWKAGGIAIGAGIPAGVVGAGAGIVANGVFTGQWEFDPAAILGGVGGGLVGGVHGVAGHAQSIGMARGGYTGLSVPPPVGADGSHERPDPRVVEVNEGDSGSSRPSSLYDGDSGNHRSPSVHSTSDRSSTAPADNTTTHSDSTTRNGRPNTAETNGKTETNNSAAQQNNGSQQNNNSTRSTDRSQSTNQSQSNSGSGRSNGTAPAPQPATSSHVEGQTTQQPATRTGIDPNSSASQPPPQSVHAQSTDSPVPPATSQTHSAATSNLEGNSNNSTTSTAQSQTSVEQPRNDASTSSPIPQSAHVENITESPVPPPSAQSSTGIRADGPPAQPVTANTNVPPSSTPPPVPSSRSEAPLPPPSVTDKSSVQSSPQSPRPSISSVGDGSARPLITAGVRTDPIPNTQRASTSSAVTVESQFRQVEPAQGPQDHLATPKQPEASLETSREPATSNETPQGSNAPKGPETSLGSARDSSDFPTPKREDPVPQPSDSISPEQRPQPQPISEKPPAALEFVPHDDFDPTPQQAAALPGHRLERLPTGGDGLFRAIDHVTGGKLGPEGTREKFVQALQQRKDNLIGKFVPDDPDFREAAREIARIDANLRDYPDHPDRRAWETEREFHRQDLELERSLAFDLQHEQLSQPGPHHNQLGDFLLSAGADANDLHLVVVDRDGTMTHFGPQDRPEHILVRADETGDNYHVAEPIARHPDDPSTHPGDGARIDPPARTETAVPPRDSSPLPPEIVVGDPTPQQAPWPQHWAPVPDRTDPLFTTVARILGLPDATHVRSGITDHLNRLEQQETSWRATIEEERRQNRVDETQWQSELERRQQFENWLDEQRNTAAAPPTPPTRDTVDRDLHLAASAFGMNVVVQHSDGLGAEHAFVPGQRNVFLRYASTGEFEIGVTPEGNLFAAHRHPSPPAPLSSVIDQVVPRSEIPPPLNRVLASPQTPLLDGAALAPHYTGEGRPIAVKSQLDPIPDAKPLAVQERLPYHTPVRHMSPAELENHRLFVHEGRLFRAADGRLFDTTQIASAREGGDARAIFVMDEFGNLYAGDQELGSLHHSSFLGGRTVTGAGEIEVRDGRLVVLSDRSGHYLPRGELNDYAVDLLRRQGLSLDENFTRLGFDNQPRERFGEVDREQAELTRRQIALDAAAEALSRKENALDRAGTPDDPDARRIVQARRELLNDEQNQLNRWKAGLDQGIVQPELRDQVVAHPNPTGPNDRITPPRPPLGLDGTNPAADRTAAWWRDTGESWWNNLRFDDLSPAYQHGLVTDFPGLRNSEGIPAAVRNTLNTTYIQHEIQRLDKIADGSSLSSNERRQLNNLKAVLTDLNTADIDSAIAAHRAGTAQPATHLLSFDQDAQGRRGREVIGFGPVDAATTVHWQAPPNASLGSAGHAVAHAAQQHVETARTQPHHATVMWVDNDSTRGASGPSRLVSKLFSGPPDPTPGRLGTAIAEFTGQHPAARVHVSAPEPLAKSLAPHVDSNSVTVHSGRAAGAGHRLFGNESVHSAESHGGAPDLATNRPDRGTETADGSSVRRTPDQPDPITTTVDPGSDFRGQVRPLTVGDTGPVRGLEAGHLNDCGPLALNELVRLNNSPVIHPPEGPVGLAGMSAEEIQRAAGAPLQHFGGHDRVAEHLRGLGDGATALVVDTYHGPADQYGVGAHAYVLINDHGSITVRDPSTGADRPFIAQTPAHVQDTHAVLYTDTGQPHTVDTGSTRPLPDVRVGAIDSGPRHDTFGVREFLERFGGTEYPPGTVMYFPTPTPGMLRIQFGDDHHVLLTTDVNSPPPEVNRRTVDDFWNHIRANHDEMGLTDVTVAQPAHFGDQSRRIWDVSDLKVELVANGFDSKTSIKFHDGDHRQTAIVRKDGNIEIRESGAEQGPPSRIVSRTEFETILDRHDVQSAEVTLPVPESWHRVAPGQDNLFPTLTRILNEADPTQLRREVAVHLQENQDFYAGYISSDHLDSLWSNPENHQDPNFPAWAASQRPEILKYEISKLYHESGGTGYHYAGPAKMEFALYGATWAKQMNITTLDPHLPRNEVPNFPGRPQIFLRRAEDGAYEVGMNRDGTMFSVVRPDMHVTPDEPPTISMEMIPKPLTKMLAGGPEPLLEGAALQKRYLGEQRPMVPKSILEQRGSAADFAEHPIRHYHTPIHYMDSAEREMHRLFIGPDGRLYNARDGYPFDTTDHPNTIFVMDEFANLYAAEKKTGLIQHSSFFGGRTITGAGFIGARDGYLTEIMDSSGHYMPDSQMNDYAIAALKTQGLRISGSFEHKYMNRDGHWVARDPEVEAQIQQNALARAERILADGPTPTRPFKIYRTEQAQDQLTWNDFPPGTTISFRGDDLATTATVTNDQNFQVIDRPLDGSHREQQYHADPAMLQDLISARDVETVKVEQPEFPPRTAQHDESTITTNSLLEALPTIHEEPRTALPPGFDQHLNNCAPLALHELITATGSTVARLPEHPVGLDGMAAAEFQHLAGAPLQSFTNHQAIGRHLTDLGPGATALVVDTYRGPADQHGVGAHAYLITNEHGTITVKDPSTGAQHPLREHTSAPVDTVHAVIYDAGGQPHTVEQVVAHPLPTARIGAGNERTGSFGIEEFLTKFEGSEYPVSTKLHLQGPDLEATATFTNDDHVMVDDLHDPANPPALHTIDDFWSMLRSDHEAMGLDHVEVFQPALQGDTGDRVQEISYVTEKLSRNEFTTGTILELHSDTTDSVAIVRRDGAFDLHDLRAEPVTPPPTISRPEFETLISDHEVHSAKVTLPVPDSWHRISSADEQLFPTLARILNAEDPAAVRQDLANYLRRHPGHFTPLITNDRLDSQANDPANRANPRFEGRLQDQRAALLGREISKLLTSAESTGSRAIGPGRAEFLLMAAATQHQMNITTLDPNGPRVNLNFGRSKPTIFLRRPEGGGYEVGVTETGNIFSTVQPSLPRIFEESGDLIPPDQIPKPLTEMLAGGPEPLLEGAAIDKRYLGERRPLVPRSELPERGDVADFAEDPLTHFHTPIHYMDAAEREAHRRFVGPDGRLYNAHDGRVFDTGGSTSWIFVMDEFGNLYSAGKETGLIQHSSFVGGHPIFGGGFMQVVAGRVTDITDSSGHYMPNSQMNDYAIALLRAQGLQLDENFARTYLDTQGEFRTRDRDLEDRIQEAALARAERILTDGPTPTRPFLIHRIEESYSYLEWDDFRPGTKITFHDEDFVTTAIAREDHTFRVTDRSRDGSSHARTYDADVDTMLDLVVDRDIETVKIEKPEYPPRPGASESTTDLTALREALPEVTDPPPTRPAADDNLVNECAQLTLSAVVDLTGSQVVRVPEGPVGLNGMDVTAFERAAGASLEHFRDHGDIASHLFRLGDGAVAVVVDSYWAPADEHGVGAHAYLIVNDDRDMVVVDPTKNEEYSLSPDNHTAAEVRSTDAIIYTADGRPHRTGVGTGITGAEAIGDVRIGAGETEAKTTDVPIRAGHTDDPAPGAPKRALSGTPPREGDGAGPAPKTARLTDASDYTTAARPETAAEFAAANPHAKVDDTTVSRLSDNFARKRLMSGTTIFFGGQTDPVKATVMHDGNVRIHGTSAEGTPRHEIVTFEDFQQLLADRDVTSVAHVSPTPATWYRPPSDGETTFSTLAHVLKHPDPQELRNRVADLLEREHRKYVERFIPPGLQAKVSSEEAHWNSVLERKSELSDQEFQNAKSDHEQNLRNLAGERDQEFRAQIAALRSGNATYGHYRGSRMDFMLATAGHMNNVNIILEHPNGSRERFTVDSAKPYVLLKASDDNGYDIGVDHRGGLFSTMVPIQHLLSASTGDVVPKADIPPKFTEMLASTAKPALSGTAVQHNYLAENKPMIVDNGIRERLAPDRLAALDAVINSGELQNRPKTKPVSHHHTPVHYMDELERETHRLFVGPGGRFFRAFDGRLFDTSAGDRHGNMTIFVEDEFGNFYAAVKLRGTLQHSSFFGGRIVSGAGFVMAQAGRPTLIAHSSGHYQPSAGLNNAALAVQQARGLVLHPKFESTDRRLHPLPSASEEIKRTEALARAQQILATQNTPAQTRYYRTDNNEHVNQLARLGEQNFPPGSSAQFSTATLSTKVTFSDGKYVVHDVNRKGEERTLEVTRAQLVRLILDREITSIAVTTPQEPRSGLAPAPAHDGTADGSSAHARPTITAAAVPGSEFHGHVEPPTTSHVEQIRGQIDSALHSAVDGHGGLQIDPIDPKRGEYRVTDTSGVYSNDQHSFTVRVETQRIGDDTAARSILNHDKGQHVIQISDRISTKHVPRALAHEIGEIVADRKRYLVDKLDSFGPRDGVLHPGGPTDRPGLTPHDAGRIQELRVLGDELDGLPATQQSERNALRGEAMALVDHLGLREGTPGAQERRTVVFDHLDRSASGSAHVRTLLDDAGREPNRLPPEDQQLLQRIQDQATDDRARFEAHRAALRPAFERPIAFDGERATPEQTRILADQSTQQRAQRSAETLAELRTQAAAAPQGEYPKLSVIEAGGGAALAARDPQALLVDDRGRWQSDNGDRIAQTADQLRNLRQTGLGDPYQFVGEGRPDARVPLDAVRYWEDTIAAQGPVVDGRTAFRMENGKLLADITPLDGGPPITVDVQGIPVIATGFPPEIIPGIARGIGGMHGTFDTAARELGNLTASGAPAAKAQIQALSWRDPASAGKALEILSANGIDPSALSKPTRDSLGAIDNWKSLRDNHPGKILSGDEANLAGVDPNLAKHWIVAGTGGTGISGVENMLKLSNDATFTMIGRNAPPGLADNTQWKEVRGQHDLGYDHNNPRAASQKINGVWPNPTATGRLTMAFDRNMNIGGIEERPGSRFVVAGFEGDGVIASLGTRNSVPPAVADLVDTAIKRDPNSVSARMLFDNDGQYLGYRITADGRDIDVTGAASRFFPGGQLFKPGTGDVPPLPAVDPGKVWSTQDSRYALSRPEPGFAAQNASNRDAPPEGGNFDGGYVASATQATHYAGWRRNEVDGSNVITAAAVPGSEFHGHVAPPTTSHVEQIRGGIDSALNTVIDGHGGLRIDPIATDKGAYRVTDTSGVYGTDQRSFTVRVETQRIGDDTAARSILNHDKGQHVIQISDRISTKHLPRALAHEIGEIVADRKRYLIDKLDAFGPDEGVLRPGGPTNQPPLTPHDTGRIQELRVLGEQLDALPDPAGRTPEDRTRYAELHREAMALVEHLGLRDGIPGSEQRRALVLDHLESAPTGRDHVRQLLDDAGGNRDQLSANDQRLLRSIQRQAGIDQAAFDAHRAALRPAFERPIAFDGERATPEQTRTLADQSTQQRAERSVTTLADLREQAKGGDYPKLSVIEAGGGAALAARDPQALLIDDRGRWQSDNGDRIAQTADQLRNLRQTGLGDPYQFVGEGRPDARVPLDAVRYWEDTIAAQGPVIDGKASFRMEDGKLLADITPLDNSAPLTVEVQGIPVIATGFPPEIIPGTREVGGMHGTFDTAAKELDKLNTPAATTAKGQIEALSWRDPASAAKTVDILTTNGIARSALSDNLNHALDSLSNWKSLRDNHPGKILSGDEANLAGVDPNLAKHWIVAGTGGTGISGVENMLKLSNDATFTMIGRNAPPGLADNTQWKEVRGQHDLGYDVANPTAASKQNPDGSWPNPTATGRLTMAFDRNMNIAGIEERPGPQGTQFAVGIHTGDGVIASLGTRNSVPPAVADLVDAAIKRDPNSVSGQMLFDSDGQYLGYRITVDGRDIDVTGAASRFFPGGQLFRPGNGAVPPLPATNPGTVWRTNDSRYALSRPEPGFAAQNASNRDAPPEGGNFDGGYVASAIQATHYAAWRRGGNRPFA